MHAAEPSIIVEPISSDSNSQLSFSISVFNPNEEPLKIGTDYEDPINYELGNYKWKEQNQILFLKKDYVILSGEKKVVRYFTHDLKMHPPPDSQKAVVTVEVKGLGEVTHEFELEKPGFFENLLGGIFGPKALRQAQGEGQGDVGQGNESTVIASSEGGKQSASNPAVPSSVIPAQAGIQAPASEPSTSPATNEAPINQTPSSTPPPQTEPQVQTPVEEPEPEEPSAPVINPPAQLPSDTTPPSVPSVNSLPQAVNTVSVILSGAKELHSSIWVNGIEKVNVNNATVWNASIDLVEGTNFLRVESRDAAGNTSSAVTVSIIRDTIAPMIQTVNITNVTETGGTIQLQASEKITAILTYQAEGETPKQLQCLVPSEVCDFLLENLKPDTEYSFFIEIRDKVLQTATSTTNSLHTLTAGENPFETPTALFNPLSQNFRFGNVYLPYFCCYSLGDLNQDGVSELGSFDSVGGNYSLAVMHSQSDGSYSPNNLISYPVSNVGIYIRFLIPAGDLNQDGYQDIVLGSAQGIYLYASQWQNGKVEYQQAQNIIPANENVGINQLSAPYYLAGNYADFNKDGIVDLLVRDRTSWWEHLHDQNGNYTGSVRRESQKHYLILSNKPAKNYDAPSQWLLIDPGLQEPVNFNLASFSDINGDGMAEILIIAHSSDYKNTYFRMHPSPSYQTSESWDAGTLEGYFKWSADVTQNDGVVFDAGDLDGDNHREFFGSFALDNTPNQPKFPALLFFNSQGRFQKLETLTMEGRPEHAVRISDFNGDSIEDLAFFIIDTGPTDAAVYLYASQGGGFALNEPPSHILFLPPNAVMENFIGPWTGRLSVRPRIENGTAKKDLIVRAEASSTGLGYTDILWKEK